MSNIAKVFTNGRKALIAYITVGYPDIETTMRMVPLLIENGCDIIELGIPFSDPLADGVTIQNASYRALQNGIDTAQCLQVAGRLNKTNSAGTPLVFMTYYNPVLNFGLEKFCRECSDSGISGLIIPDLPPEEGQELQTCASRHGLDIIYLLAPNSPDERIKLVAGRSQGFVYLVSLTGVTGVRDQQTSGLEEFVKRVRREATQALCVGFGIATPEHAAQVARFADGVIIGSRIIQLMESDTSLNSVSKFIRDVRNAIS